MAGIQHIKRNDLNVQKWNACIDAASNGLIYAYSFYLDALCDNWDALVMGDYEAVMPLPWRKKWGIKYVYRPAFIQQLGIFGNLTLTEITNTFLLKASSLFDFGEYFINYENEPQPKIHCNLVLSLKSTYSHIQNHYKKKLIYDLKKAKKKNLHFAKTSDYSKAIKIYNNLYKKRIKHLSKRDVDKLYQACFLLAQKNMLCIREVTCEKHGLLSIALCFVDKKRIYFIVSSTTEHGRISKANHYLIDRLIHEFSEKDLILDFEGSELPGIQHFYRNFGPSDQPYFFYRWNNLPWPIRWLKK